MQRWHFIARWRSWTVASVLLMVSGLSFYLLVFNFGENIPFHVCVSLLLPGMHLSSILSLLVSQIPNFSSDSFQSPFCWIFVSLPLTHSLAGSLPPSLSLSLSLSSFSFLYISDVSGVLGCRCLLSLSLFLSLSLSCSYFATVFRSPLGGGLCLTSSSGDFQLGHFGSLRLAW